MDDDRVSYFLYTDIAGAGKGWTLAVLAEDMKDANFYVRIMHRSGRCVGSVKGGGTVKADCGAITEKARILQTRNDLAEKGCGAW